MSERSGTVKTSLFQLAEQLGMRLEAMPYSLRIVLENVHRNRKRTSEGVAALELIANWRATAGEVLPLYPTRVVMPDSSGIPVLLDLAALRSGVSRAGGAPDGVSPAIPVDVIIDHSLQVDTAGSRDASLINVEHEFARNNERYRFLKWARQAFDGVRVFPPGSGIIHQINLEYLAQVIQQDPADDGQLYPEFVLGADSHTSMINGIGVLGWGVGGLEIESVLLGHPYALPVPRVIGVELAGQFPKGATSTDLVLHLTQLLRSAGVVGCFVEFFGAGLDSLTVPDRATIANMSPESGATATYFPIDSQTLRYLERTGRSREHVSRTEAYVRRNGLLREEGAAVPAYSSVLRFDLAKLEPAVSGPHKPQQRLALNEIRGDFEERLTAEWRRSASPGTSQVTTAPAAKPGSSADLLPGDGAIVIAAIASCTNTSNPSVMLAAGLLARRAVELGLRPPPYVKTSMTPGSLSVTEYLGKAGLSDSLDALGFQVAGYGCATCGGKSGPLNPGIDEEIVRRDLVATAVLSGNRNFPGRIHRFVRGSYLASPPLVIAYALAGRINVDLNVEPVGHTPEGRPVYLRDLWPAESEVQALLPIAYAATTTPAPISGLLAGSGLWQALEAPSGPLFTWDPESSYLLEPPFFETPPAGPVEQARVLALFGDSLTTDHISPSGEIPPDTPAGEYLLDLGITQETFNTYVGRRGNHDVMTRATFANIRLRNELVPGTEGGFTRVFPDGEITTIFAASQHYRDTKTPLVVLAGAEYGTGSSRDWASKGTALLGVRAVIAESYERIHRTNLAASGVLPLRFTAGQGWRSLGLDGSEEISIRPLETSAPGEARYYSVHAVKDSGKSVSFEVEADVSGSTEWKWLESGGVLPLALQDQLQERK
jgi:aconitate hydratase